LRFKTTTSSNTDIVCFHSTQTESGATNATASPELSDSSESSDYQPIQRGRGRVRRRAVGGRARGGRGRARGGRRGIGLRGRGRGRVAAPRQADEAFQSYTDNDIGNNLPDFLPNRPPGLHFTAPILRGSMTRALDFFKLFITNALLLEICQHTNGYAWGVIGNKQYYANNDGAWQETNPQEIEHLIALLIYMGLVNVATFHRYWSTKSLYHGLWARSIMSRDRFKALLAVLHIVDPNTEDERDKLRKVRSFMDSFKELCKTLYQPFQHVAVDERMVKSKHRSGIRQYIRDKPTKWGIKLWVLADSLNGYTCDFDVYVGKRAADEVQSVNGLGYDVVMKLIQPLVNQGYHIYFDNFYTSPKLVLDLFNLLLPSCGTSAENRRGFPESMKKGKEWARRKERGTMRWVREGDNCLAMQWKDNRVVTMLSSIHNANDFVMVERKEKVNARWTKVMVRQPKTIDDYNNFMNGVDLSDQIIGKNNVLRKCMRWWKTLFFHMIDIAVVNSFILFQMYRRQNEDVQELKRPQKYSLAEYREELVRQLSGLEEYGQPPVFRPGRTKEPAQFETVHIPQFSDTKRNCKVCYKTSKTELKVISYCSAPQCQVYLHCTQKNNCFAIWHSNAYHQ